MFQVSNFRFQVKCLIGRKFFTLNSSLFTLHFSLFTLHSSLSETRSTNSDVTKSASPPFSVFCFRKLGKKKTFRIANMIKILMPIISHKVLPSVICRNPS